MALDNATLLPTKPNNTAGLSSHMADSLTTTVTYRLTPPINRCRRSHWLPSGVTLRDVEDAKKHFRITFNSPARRKSVTSLLPNKFIYLENQII